MLVLRNTQTNQTRAFSDIDSATVALNSGWVHDGQTPGQEDQVASFEGGLLVAGAPLNAWIFGVWYTGQQDIISPYWQNGQIQIPPAQIQTLPTVDPPADVVAGYAAYTGATGSQNLVQAHQNASQGLFGLSPMVLLGLGAVAFLALGRSRS